MNKKNKAIPKKQPSRLEEAARQNTERLRRVAAAEEIIKRMRKEKLGCLDEEIKVELARQGLAWPQ